MKKLFSALTVVLSGYYSYAQTNTFPPSGNVGIGTTNPSRQLEIVSGTGVGPLKVTGPNGYLLIDNVGSGESYYQANSFHQFQGSGGAPLMTIFNNGQVGIGTTTPGAILDVSTLLSPGTLGTVLARLAEGNTTGAGTYLGIKGYNTQPNGSITNINDIVSFSIEHSFYGVTNSSINFLRGGSTSGGSISFNTNNNSEMMRLLYNGNVLIGKTSQTNAAYKLDVAGSIRANQIVVNTTGADFVFEPAYRLRSLSKLKKYINQNHHLPEIPSAEQMKNNGLSVGEMNTRLLQKVEELTLYIIDQNKQLADQKKINQSLQEQINSLSNAIKNQSSK